MAKKNNRLSFEVHSVAGELQISVTLLFVLFVIERDQSGAEQGMS